MPGIVGIVSPADGAVLPEVLQKMVKPIIRKPKMAVETYIDETTALAAIRLEQDEEHLAVIDGVSLVVNGHIIQQENLLHLLPSESSPPAGLAELLLKVYLTCGIDHLCCLNGLYVIAIWEENLRKLTIVKDRLGGTCNLYYWHTPKRLLFASEMKAIAWHPQFDQTIDPVAVCDLFANQIPSGDRTLFANIRSLMGGDVLTFQDDILKITSYWKPAFRTDDMPVANDEDYLEEMAYHLRNAVQRRIRPNTCLFVTGGLDSRTLVGLHQREAPDTPLSTATIGKKTGQDQIIGQKVAQAAGVPHHWIPLGDDYLSRYAALSAWRAEGKMGSYASWIYAGEPFLEEHGFQYAITGHYGNFISGRTYPHGLGAAATLEEAANIIRNRYTSALAEFRQIMCKDRMQPALEISKDYAADVFRNSTGTSKFNRFDETVLKGSMARSASGTDALGDVATVLDPFIDNDLIDFVLLLPEHIRTSSWFYIRMITKNLPEMAAVPYGRTGHLLKNDLLLNQYPFLEKLDYYRRRTLKRAFPTRYSEEALGCIPYNEALHKGSRQLMLDTLVKAEYLEDFFDMGAVRKMIEAQQARHDGRLYRPLTILMTLALFREQFAQLQ